MHDSSLDFFVGVKQQNVRKYSFFPGILVFKKHSYFEINGINCFSFPKLFIVLIWDDRLLFQEHAVWAQLSNSLQPHGA